MTEELLNSYNSRCAGKEGDHEDIKDHLPILSMYASKCARVVEFGVRTGNSTTALLHGLELSQTGGTLYSFDIAEGTYYAPPLERAKWVFVGADTGALISIPHCDLLFIDTLHTAEHLAKELKHAVSAYRWIIIHDTTEWGDKGELEQPGITRAIYAFLSANPNTWFVEAHYPNCNGLLVLRRR